MRRWFLIIALIIGLSISVSAFGYDATGIWQYSAHTHTNTCGPPEPNENGEMGILQTGSSFLIIGDDASTTGTTNGFTYSFTDYYCEEGGNTVETATVTLTSATTGSGSGSWTWTGNGGPCYGTYQLTITKTVMPSTPTYNANGRWNFTQSGSFNTCNPQSQPPSPSGYFDVTQTGTSITAVDDDGLTYSGFVTGATYYVIRSYPDDGGTTTEVYIITLTSATQGSGQGEFVWDDSCSDCYGQWNISINKVVTSSGNPISPQIFLLDDSN